jgi:hypothetical protein
VIARGLNSAVRRVKRPEKTGVHLMSASEHSDLKRLSDPVREHNAIGDQIAGVIGRPAERGHVGEYVVAQIFNITLERSARKRARDGRFTAGALAGRTVNVKWYGKAGGRARSPCTRRA